MVAYTHVFRGAHFGREMAAKRQNKVEDCMANSTRSDTGVKSKQEVKPRSQIF